MTILAVTLSACVPSLGTQFKAPLGGEFVHGKVAGDFPDNLPLYKNAQVVESFSDRESSGASFIVDDSLSKVVNFYSSALPQLGWQSSLSQKSDTNFQFDIKNETYSGVVIVNTASDGKMTAITMNVELR